MVKLQTSEAVKLAWPSLLLRCHCHYHQEMPAQRGLWCWSADFNGISPHADKHPSICIFIFPSALFYNPIYIFCCCCCCCVTKAPKNYQKKKKKVERYRNNHLGVNNRNWQRSLSHRGISRELLACLKFYHHHPPEAIVFKFLSLSFTITTQLPGAYNVTRSTFLSNLSSYRWKLFTNFFLLLSLLISSPRPFFAFTIDSFFFLSPSFK